MKKFLLVITYDKWFTPKYQIITNKGVVVKDNLTRKQGLSEIKNYNVDINIGKSDGPNT